MARDKHHMRRLGNPDMDPRYMRQIWDIILDVCSMRKSGAQFYLDDNGELVEMSSRKRFPVTFKGKGDLPEMALRLQKRDRPNEWVRDLMDNNENESGDLD